MIKSITGRQSASARGLIGFTRADVAKAIGVQGPTISTFERGKTKMEAPNMEALIAFYESRNIAFIASSRAEGAFLILSPE